MQVTEVRINLCGNGGASGANRLKAFCSLTFDDTFVIRDVKLIDGNDGLFLAMPSRKLCDHCRRCGEKNHLRARFCNGCGVRLDENRSFQAQDAPGGNGHAGNGHPGNSTRGSGHGAPTRVKLHADIAHPINGDCRQLIERRVLDAYRDELQRSRQPGYVAPSLDAEEMDYADDPRVNHAPAARAIGARQSEP